MPPKKRSSGDLVIVESPAKAKTIERYLGPGYTVTASYGHVRDLPQRSLGVDLEHDFAPRYEPLKERRKELEKLADQARKADIVWLATDLDREGESIAWHIADYAGLDDDRVRRVTFSEITKGAIDAAFAHPRAVNLDLVNAQQARRVIDRLVGYKLSPLVSSKIRRGLSAGRVQSVAVRLVVDREREITAFKADEYWTIAAELKRRAGAGQFSAELTRIDGKKAKIGSEAEAREHEAALRAAEYAVESVSTNAAEEVGTAAVHDEHPPAGGVAQARLRGRRTMSVAQSLYEGVALPEGQVGLITYMRTDSLSIASGAVAEARKVIERPVRRRVRARQAERLPEPQPRRAGGARGDPPVELRRARRKRLRSHLKPDEFRLYELIWKRATASQMSPARFDQVGVDVTAGPLHAPRRGAQAGLRRLPGGLRRGARRRGGRAPDRAARPA